MNLPALGCSALLLGAMAASASNALAQSPAIQQADWLMTSAAFLPTPLVHSLRNDRLRDTLGYADRDEPRVFVHDLNRDGMVDRLFISSESQCANATCQLILIDGRSGREIGQFFGTLILRAERRNGFPIVETLSPDGGDLTKLTRYTFNGQYQPDESALINQDAVDRLLADLVRQ